MWPAERISVNENSATLWIVVEPRVDAHVGSPDRRGWDVEQHGVAAGCDGGEGAVGDDSGADREAHPDDGEAETVEDALPRCRGAVPRGPGTGRRVRCVVLEHLRRIIRQPQIVAAVDGLEHEDRSAAE